jgi:predicted site-specific integrase-resolvase
MYSIGQFAKIINKSVNTLQRWDREGRLKAKRTPTNRRYYTEKQLMEYRGLISNIKSLNIAYCRVSSSNQRDDLKNQKKYINDFCLNKGIDINDFYVDVASGLNFKRKKFNQLLNDVEHGKIKNIIIAHKDRFVRFGYEWFENFCSKHGCNILVINDEKLSPENEMIEDLISIIHVFSCRIYGLRKYKNEISKENKNKNK